MKRQTEKPSPTNVSAEKALLGAILLDPADSRLAGIETDGSSAGAGTSGLVALRYDRNFLGIELKPEYAEMARRRLDGDAPMFNMVEVVQP